jgi:hypothetical protein
MRAKLKAVRSAVLAFIGLLIVLALPPAAWAGGLPLMPSSPTYSEPSQIVGTMNALIQQLNGQTGYATQPNSIVSLGTFCTASGATPQTCNGSRGVVTTATLTTAAVAAANYVINDSLITAANACRATVTAYSGTFHTNGIPYVATVTTGTGTITVSLGNVDATNALNGTVGMTFDCIN